MPIFKTPQGILYFAHVPKCAGTSIENYIIQRFGLNSQAFLDRSHLSKPTYQRWSRCSPQHIDAINLSNLFLPTFFDATFAMVRHPAIRLRSVYLFQRDIQKAIHPTELFSDWLDALPYRRYVNPFYLDNHASPMTEIVPSNAKVFRLEEGIDQIVYFLDGFSGDQAGAREIGFENSYDEYMQRMNLPSDKRPCLTIEDLEKIQKIYHEDYERFGYEFEIEIQ